jgi:hypothetical protein
MYNCILAYAYPTIYNFIPPCTIESTSRNQNHSPPSHRLKKSKDASGWSIGTICPENSVSESSISSLKSYVPAPKICMKVRLPPLFLILPYLSPLSSFKSLTLAFWKSFCPGHSRANDHAWFPSQLQMKSASPA